MALDSLSFVNYNRVGVYPDGSPVYYDPKKAQKKPISFDYDPETGKAGKKLPGIDNPFGSINPTKDKVYYDPKTGEYTTWKPGIYNPEQNDSKKTVKKAATLAAIVVAAITAFVFRGKIKNGGQKVLDLAKPYLEKAGKYVPKSVKDVAKKGLEAIKPAITKAKDFATKGYNAVKPYITKATEFVSKNVAEPLKNLFSKSSKAAATAAKAAV